MMTTRLAIATLVAVGLAATPLAAQAKKYKHLRHYISTTQSESPGLSETSDNAKLRQIRIYCRNCHRSVNRIV